jgi:hypothetical protein
VLIQKGVPPGSLTLEELLHSSNLSGLVRATFYELPELVPKVPIPPPGPGGSQSKATRPDGPEAYEVEGSVIYAPPGGIQTDVEITVVDANRTRRKLPKMSLTMTVGPNGLEEVGAEFTLLKRQLKKQLCWGAVRDVKFAVKFNAQVKFERDGARDVLDGWAAKFKASVSADLGIPRSIAVPVEAWVYIDAGGKPGPALYRFRSLYQAFAAVGRAPASRTTVAGGVSQPVETAGSDRSSVAWLPSGPRCHPMERRDRGAAHGANRSSRRPELRRLRGSHRGRAGGVAGRL